MAKSRAALFAVVCIRSAIFIEGFLPDCYFVAYKRQTTHTFWLQDLGPGLNGKKVALDIFAEPTLSGPMATLAILPAHIWKPRLFF